MLIVILLVVDEMDGIIEYFWFFAKRKKALANIKSKKRKNMNKKTTQTNITLMCSNFVYNFSIASLFCLFFQYNHFECVRSSIARTYGFKPTKTKIKQINKIDNNLPQKDHFLLAKAISFCSWTIMCHCSVFSCLFRVSIKMCLFLSSQCHILCLICFVTDSKSRQHMKYHISRISFLSVRHLFLVLVCFAIALLLLISCSYGISSLLNIHIKYNRRQVCAKSKNVSINRVYARYIHTKFIA